MSPVVTIYIVMPGHLQGVISEKHWAWILTFDLSHWGGPTEASYIPGSTDQTLALAHLPHNIRPALHAHTQTHRLAVLSNQRKLSNEWLSTLHRGHLALSPWQRHQSSTAPVLHWSMHTSTQRSLHPNTGANTNMYCICRKLTSETELTIQNGHSYITVYTHVDTITLTQIYTYSMYLHRVTHESPPTQLTHIHTMQDESRHVCKTASTSQMTHCTYI